MITDLALIGYLIARSTTRRLAERWVGDDRGEGVISAAIAVLIMAFLGAAMWIVFRQILTDTGTKTQNQLDNIGG